MRFGRGDDIEGDHDMVTFNPTASTVLKWLRFKFMSYENEMK
jgi:hypothetical protein